MIKQNKNKFSKKKKKQNLEAWLFIEKTEFD